MITIKLQELQELNALMDKLTSYMRPYTRSALLSQSIFP